MQKPLHYVVPRELDGQRLDKLVAHYAGVSRRVARTWIASGRVHVGSKVVRILTRPVRAGASIRIETDDSPRTTSQHELSKRALSQHRAASEGNEALSILYCDQWIVAVSKPAGLLSETDRFGGPSVESLLPRLLTSHGEKKTHLWLVHRLDAGTSGVLLLARTPAASAALGEAFRAQQVAKTYWALCSGAFTQACDVDGPIARVQGTRHGVRDDGKSALTHFTPRASSARGSFVVAQPKSGRTHQIRVHLAHLGHPILGDRLYGGPGYTDETPMQPIGRPMLHAHRLEIAHPKHKTPLVLTSPAPADFRSLAAYLGFAMEAPDAG